MATTAVRKSPVGEVLDYGQSLWLDNIRRQLITSGELVRLRDEGVRGVTSNPTIFEKAVAGSTDYDEALVRLVRAGTKPEEILWELMVEDITAAADVFRPIYDQTKGADGFVSIEVGPREAYDTKRTIRVARELFERTARPNVMVKIPATREGLPAIREMISEGRNINITLIFSVARYAEVVEAFLSGLEEFKSKGGDPSRVASVASFFVSRIDSKVDKLLEKAIEKEQDPRRGDEMRRLLGRTGINNSKMAYQLFRQLHSGPRWKALEVAGARPQRPLWASTSTKNPNYPDTMYVEELIGPDTVDTIPPATLAAFREHGEVRASLEENLDLARRQLDQLEQLGIDLDDVTHEVEVEGVDAFVKSFEALLKTLKDRARDIKQGRGPRQWHNLGALQPTVDGTVKKLQEQDAAKKLWAKDSTLWSSDPEQRKPIRDRLGWLDVAEKMLEEQATFRELAREARVYSDVVLLGMGGSSLCPDVLRHTFPAKSGHPKLHVLDTTDPATILRLQSRINIAESLFIVSSKSGGTIETLSHFAYFWPQVEQAVKRNPGRHFAAITDAGSPVEKLAREHDFRWIFKNPPDIGGRYSALSYFGLVPGAMMGVDVVQLLERAQEMANAAESCIEVEQNPGTWLGAVLGGLANAGHDKLTLLLSPKVSTFGYWIEQLIAESTGKQGKGILPVEGEPLGAPSAYGDDRLFVHVRMERDPEDKRVKSLEAAGQPVVTLTLRDPLDLGGEFFRWEVAVAIAGSVIGIDPFDQPNVQESKDNTNKVLQQFEMTGRFEDGYAVPAAKSDIEIRRLLGQAKHNAYFAVMAYTERTAASERALRAIRERVRDSWKIATTAGYGPRFLHSTGQYHKGGPPTGIFLQVIQQDRKDPAIPGKPYGFSTLKQAQAIGDFQALESRKLPVLRVELGDSPSRAWPELVRAVEKAVR